MVRLNVNCQMADCATAQSAWAAQSWMSTVHRNKDCTAHEDNWCRTSALQVLEWIDGSGHGHLPVTRQASNQQHTPPDACCFT